ncbi:MAG: SDR family NAD(P)-dependent oxidoreductase [Spirochaetes bacterium]|nr:SDR family NAD(P)-dependent oxidoreductase [Spirochaetota bacterium]
MKEFKDKVGFITGGASGLGFGLAKVFTEAGSKIVIADIRQDHIDEAMEYFKGTDASVHAIKLDITDRKAFARAADEVEEVFGCPPELLFNNAGVNTFGPVEATTYDDWDWVLGVNLYGVINGITTFLPRMIKAGKGGLLYITSSGGGLMGSPGCVAYSAAKAAVINMAESYRMGLQHYGIQVAVCCPGGIKTNIGESAKIRPDHLKNSGYIEDEKVINALNNVYEKVGIDPYELATIVKKAVENDKFYILPPGMGRELVEMRNKELLDSIVDAPPMTPEEMEKMAEGWSYMKDVGGIKEDLDWVKPAPPRPMGPPNIKDKK